MSYSVTIRYGEEDLEHETFANITHRSKYYPATFDDPEEGGELEFEFVKEDGSPDTFAQSICSDLERERIESYLYEAVEDRSYDEPDNYYDADYELRNSPY